MLGLTALAIWRIWVSIHFRPEGRKMRLPGNMLTAGQSRFNPLPTRRSEDAIFMSEKGGK